MDCLITVAMAYEGLDVPAITHLICLTHIRTKPWIEQVVHRVTRMDPLAGSYAQQRVYIYVPDDRPFRECLEYILSQRNMAIAGSASSSQALGDEAYPNGQGVLSMIDRAGSSIQPLHSGVLGMSNQALWANLVVPAQSEIYQETPKERLDRLRQQIENMSATTSSHEDLHMVQLTKPSIRSFENRVPPWLNENSTRLCNGLIKHTHCSLAQLSIKISLADETRIHVQHV